MNLYILSSIEASSTLHCAPPGGELLGHFLRASAFLLWAAVLLCHQRAGARETGGVQLSGWPGRAAQLLQPSQTHSAGGDCSGLESVLGRKDMSVLENYTVPLINSHQNLYLFLPKEEIRMKVRAGEVLFLHLSQELCNVILENMFYCKSESVSHSAFLCLFTVCISTVC